MKPNIVLIVMDSLRFDKVGAGHNGMSLTPNLDQIAKKGVVFSNAISQGPSTRVAMSALMSSTYGSMYGGQKILSPNRPTIQQILKQDGYTTAGISTNLYLSKPFGWGRDFDFFDDCRPENEYHRHLWMRLINQVAKRAGRPMALPKTLPAKIVFEKAQNLIRQLRSPYFLWVHLMDTHWPYIIQKFSWDAEWRSRRRVDESVKRRMLAEPPKLSDSESEELYQEYLESVRYTDEYVGGFIKEMQRKGLLENTWLVLTADHGEEFKEHGRFFHHATPYEQLAHVPLIILPPSKAQFQPGSYGCQIRMIDLVPTFLDLAGAAPPAGHLLYGESLLPIIKNSAAPVDRVAVTESPQNKVLAVRKENWKYIWDVEHDLRMLYNLVEDPVESKNQVTIEKDRAENYHNILAEHQRLVGLAHLETQENDFIMTNELSQRLRDLGYVE